MDGIQPFSGGYNPISPTSHPAPAFPGAGHLLAHTTAHTLPPKTATDYLRAIRNRAWLVVAVGLLVSVGGTLLVLRMPAIFRATARVRQSSRRLRSLPLQDHQRTHSSRRRAKRPRNTSRQARALIKALAEESSAT